VDALTGAAFIGAGLVLATITVALYFWGSAVAARRGSQAWWWARFLPLLALGLATLAVIATIVNLVGAFDAVALLPAEDRATALSAVITRALWFSMAATGPAGLLYVGSIVAFTWGTLSATASAASTSRTAPPAPERPKA
jgi:hypothetical protein